MVPSGQKQPSTSRVLFCGVLRAGRRETLGAGWSEALGAGRHRELSVWAAEHQAWAVPPAPSRGEPAAGTDLDLQVGSSAGPQARYSL